MSFLNYSRLSLRRSTSKANHSLPDESTDFSPRQILPHNIGTLPEYDGFCGVGSGPGGDGHGGGPGVCPGGVGPGGVPGGVGGGPGGGPGGVGDGHSGGLEDQAADSAADQADRLSLNTDLGGNPQHPVATLTHLPSFLAGGLRFSPLHSVKARAKFFQNLVETWLFFIRSHIRRLSRHQVWASQSLL